MEMDRTVESPESWADAGPGAQTTASLGRGAPVDRYIVIDKIGSGGMGIVYSAYDPELDRRVAIKVMRPSGIDSHVVGKIRDRTMREARGMAQLAHPNVVGIYDVGTVGDAVFLAMELIDGVSLKEWLRGNRSRSEILRVFLDAGRGLAAAHQRGLIHRDFKPDNVMVNQAGRALVTDFGLVRDVDAPEDELEEDVSDDDLESTFARLTQTGAFLGTPDYMAPEQLACNATDERSDQFSYCVALYEALTGAHPFPATTLRERIKLLQDDSTPSPPRESLGSGHLEKAILRGLRIDPAERYESMEALLHDLTPSSSPSKHKRQLTVAVTIAAMLGGVLVYRSAVGDPDDSVCQGGEERIAAVWNADRAEQIKAAFRKVSDKGGDKVDAEFAINAAERVARILDGYGERWRLGRVAACEATHKFHEQSEEVMGLRMRCLDRRLGDLNALAMTLTRADGVSVQEGVGAASKLETIDGCADIDALMAEVSPPTDSATRAAVAALEPDYSRLRSLHLAGGYTEGGELAAKTVTRAANLGYRPAQARATYWAGVFAIANADYSRAREHLENSVWFAEASGDEALAAKGWIAHLTNLGKTRASLSELPVFERRASAAVERLRTPPRLVMELNSALGLIAQEDARFDGAAEKFEIARAAAERGGDSMRLGLALALSGIGSAKAALGKFAEAREHHELALAIQEEVLGPMHPRVADTLAQLGSAYGTMGEEKLAIASYTRATDIVEKVLGTDHRELAPIKSGLAAELLASGKAEQSIPLFDDALERMIRVHGENSKHVSRILNNRGIAHRLLGRPLDSRADLLRALQILEKVGDRASISNALSNIGDNYLTTDESSKAREYFSRSLVESNASYGPRSLRSAYAMHGLGTALVDSGQVAEAIKYFEQVLAIRIEVPAPPRKIASAKHSFGKALIRGGQRAKGCGFLVAAVKNYRDIASKRAISAADEIALEAKTARCPKN